MVPLNACKFLTVSYELTTFLLHGLQVDEATLALSSPSPASFSRRIGSPPATLKRSPLLKDTKSSVPAASAIQGPRPVVTSPLKGVASVPSPRAHSKAQGALAHKASSLQVKIRSISLSLP